MIPSALPPPYWGPRNVSPPPYLGPRNVSPPPYLGRHGVLPSLPAPQVQPLSTAKVTGAVWTPLPSEGKPLEGSYTTHFCGFTLKCSFEQGNLVAVCFDKNEARAQLHNSIQVALSHPIPTYPITEPWQIAQQWHVELPSGNQVILEPHIWTLYDDTRFPPEQSSLGAFLARHENITGPDGTEFRKQLGDLLWYVLPSLVASQPLPFKPFASQYGVLHSSPLPLHFYRKVWTQAFEEYVRLRRSDATTTLEQKGLIIPTERPIANRAYVWLPLNADVLATDCLNIHGHDVAACVLKNDPEKFCGVILNPNSNPILYLRTDILKVEEAQKLWDAQELLIWPLDYSNFNKLINILESCVLEQLQYPNSEKTDSVSTLLAPSIMTRLNAGGDQIHYCSTDDALQHLSVNNDPVSVVIGPPGCGKTTLIQKAALEFLSKNLHQTRCDNMLITSHANEPLRTLAYRMLNDRELCNRFVLYQRGLTNCKAPPYVDLHFFDNKILAIQDEFYRVKAIQTGPEGTYLNLFEVNNTTDYTKRGKEKLWELPQSGFIEGFDVSILPPNFPLANLCSKFQKFSRRSEFYGEVFSTIILCTHLGLSSFLSRNRNTSIRERPCQALGTTPFQFSEIFIDEGAQSPLPEVATALLASGIGVKPAHMRNTNTNTKVVLLGDPNQLRPYGYEPNQKSALEMLFNKPSIKTYFLTTTYRLPAPLTDLVSAMFYRGRLKPAPERKEKFSDVVKYFDVPGPRAFSVGTSLENEAQRIVACRLASLYLQQEKSVGIICFYRAEMERLKQIWQGTQVRVMTVDGCQGSESQVIILPTVNDRKGEKSDFFQDPNRLNVALTRAKETLIVIGDRNALTSGEGKGVWKHFFTHFDQMNNA